MDELVEPVATMSSPLPASVLSTPDTLSIITSHSAKKVTEHGKRNTPASSPAKNTTATGGPWEGCHSKGLADWKIEHVREEFSMTAHD